MTRMSKEASQVLEKLLGTVPEAPPIQELLDARLEEVGEGTAVVSMEATKEHHNMVRVVHGGILTSLAELAASAAIITKVEENEAFTFLDQTTNYQRPVIQGRLEAQAEVLRRGRTISLLDVTIREEGGEEVARARYTAFIKPIGES